MTDLVSFSDLRLLQLSVENVGPFRDGVQTVKFEGALRPVGQGGTSIVAPSNFFMLLAKNGQGKTTLLECIYSLMHFLGSSSIDRLHSSLFGPSARAQLDVRMTWTINDITQTVLLSIWVGDETPVVVWTPTQVDETAQASVWARLGFIKLGEAVEIGPGADELGRLIRAQIMTKLGEPPTALRGVSSDLPCVLFFPANRAIVSPRGPRSVTRPLEWGYKPALRFEMDGPIWETSIDSLLIWLEWLDDGRLGDLLDYLNERIFSKTARRSGAPYTKSL